MPEKTIHISSFAKSVYAHLSDLPFTTAAELTSFRSFPSGKQVYRALKTLERAGYISSVKHYPRGTKRHSNRFFVGAKGLNDFADVYQTTPEAVLNYFPCSLDWQRNLLRRLDSVSMIYKLCERMTKIRPESRPLTIRFPRNGNFDAFALGADGITVGFMRMGNTMMREDFKKRFWAVLNGSGADNHQRRGPPLTFVLVQTTFAKSWVSEDIIRQTFRMKGYMPCAVATEREAFDLDDDSNLWIRVDSNVSRQSFSSLVRNLKRDDSYTIEYHNSFKRVLPPKDIARLNPTELSSNKKRILNYLADWPLMKRPEIVKMVDQHKWKGTDKSRAAQSLAALRADGFIRYDTGSRNIILADGGLRYLAYRDRTDLGGLRKEWGTDGTRIAKLRRERSHTEGINEIVSRIHTEHRGLVEAIPDHSASRRFWLDRTHWRMIRPDAAIFLRLGGDTQTLHLEYEKRGSRGGKPLQNKVLVWLRYYIFEGNQFVGNVTASENPLHLTDEVTLFIVPTESIRQRMLKLGQERMRRGNWTPAMGLSVPIAITTFAEYNAASSILKDKIWLRMDDYHLRTTNPILSEIRRSSPSKSRI
ncbi:MAG: hypothetical protein F4X57_00075 [Chloroflexi bacterium]|nr:hypothetical protein [Chloroflexota bacterium]